MVINPFRNTHMHVDDIKIYNHIPATYKTITDIQGEPTHLLGKVSLEKNYPNPFNSSTNLRFSLPQASLVQLNIYNTIGQKVETLVNQRMNAGSHSVSFNAEGLPSGVYIYRLKAGEDRESRKMLLVK